MLGDGDFTPVEARESTDSARSSGKVMESTIWTSDNERTGDAVEEGARFVGEAFVGCGDTEF